MTAKNKAKLIPVFIFLLLFILTIGVYKTLESRENDNRHQVIKAHAKNALHLIDIDIAKRVQSLTRIVNRWEVRGGTPQFEFIKDAQAYLHDDPGYQAIQWVDKDLYIRWIIPLQGNEQALNLNIGFEKKRRDAFEQAKKQKTVTLSSPIDLVQGGKGLLVYKPIFVSNNFAGFVLAVFRTQKWLESLLANNDGPNRDSDFSFKISIDGELVFKSPGWDTNYQESHWQAVTAAIISGHRFQIQTRPSKAYINHSHTLLPELILLAGILLTLLITCIIYLYQKANHAVKKSQVVNRALEHEITIRKEMEEEKEKLLHNIGERVKELDCLYTLSAFAEDINSTVQSILRATVELIPASWQHSQYCSARIIFEDDEFRSNNFHESEWTQQAPISLDNKKKGVIQVFYSKALPDAGALAGPFLKEECYLIYEIANRLANIIQQKQATRLLTAERQRLAYILEGTNVGTWEWNVESGEVTFNERWANMLGYTLDEISPVSIDTWLKFAHQDDLKISGDLLEKNFNGELDYYECEARMLHKDGSWIWVLDRGKVVSRTDEGAPLLMCGTHQEITKRKQYEEKIRHLANHDSLTGLPNLRVATDRLAMALKQAQRGKTLLAILFIDLDGFKNVNDNHGHDAGDLVLKKIAKRLASSVRATDTVARIGGDEFIVLLTEMYCADIAEKIAEKIIQQVSQAISFNNINLQVGASIGIALYPDNGDDPESLLKRADDAMYVIKNSGKNGYHLAAEKSAAVRTVLQE